jgi:hypothetical protein
VKVLLFCLIVDYGVLLLSGAVEDFPGFNMGFFKYSQALLSQTQWGQEKLEISEDSRY